MRSRAIRLFFTDFCFLTSDHSSNPMIQKFSYNFLIALTAITSHKLRSFLTSLGIIFGVASVIAMLAIGKGAQEEILAQMKLLGVNNIIVKPVVEQEEGEVSDAFDEKADQKRFSPGLTLLDAKGIRAIVPHVDFVSPEIVIETTMIRSGLKRTGKLVGVDLSYFETSEFELTNGQFFSYVQRENSMPVCVIGNGIRTKFFAKEDPIGQKIKCGKLWLTVIGVLKERDISTQNIQHLGIRDYNMDVYAPITTVLLRYKNRALVTRQEIMKASRDQSEEDEETTAANYHQLDRLVIRVNDSRFISPTADIVSRMLERRHNGRVDYEIVIPEELLQQEQRAKTIFNVVLGAIASISLIVGGIGIMNIMLASVLERIKEIGIRLSMGATPLDVVLQFLGEAVAISVTGGVIGIILGVSISYGIERMTGIMTIVSPYAVLLSFIVSLTVGLVFGSYPARQAAKQDPVVCLRYE